MGMGEEMWSISARMHSDRFSSRSGYFSSRTAGKIPCLFQFLSLMLSDFYFSDHE